MSLRKKLALGTALGAVLGVGLLSPARAVITTPTLENPGSISYQQNFNNPCVFGDSSCKNPAGFLETHEPQGGSPMTYDLMSPIYTVGQIMTIIGTPTFTVGIDVNSTTKPVGTEALDLFTMSVNGVIVASYDPPTPGTLLDDPHNGNGYSDDLLKGFDLSGLSGTDTVQFHVIVNTATDGQEQFFLVSTDPTRVPEPISLGLLGVGMVGLGVARRRTGGSRRSA